MIKVYIPDNFIAERIYAVRTLLSHYCKADIEIIASADQEDYALHWAGEMLTIKDHFFGKISAGESYLQKRNIPSQVISAQSPGLDQVLILYGEDKFEKNDDSIICHTDLFAGAFFMLTRWEEAVRIEKDLHDRFPADKALIVKTGNILRPVVDEYAALLRSWMMELNFPVAKDEARYKVVPTCDVDHPYYWRGRAVWKILLKGFKRNMFSTDIIGDLKASKAVRRGTKKDPYDQFDYMMSLAEKTGTRFEFNMIGGGNTRYEGHYKITDPHIKLLMQTMMERGHKIGAHPSYASYKDAGMIKKEKDVISTTIGMEINSARQHYLRFVVADTWRYLAEAGIITDSTLGYAAEPGFRCGTSKPFPVFDIQEKKELPLMERPLLIMDVSLRFYKKYTIEESINLSQTIKDQVKKHSGEFIFLWHNSSLSEIDGWEGWNEVLENLMA